MLSRCYGVEDETESGRESAASEMGPKDPLPLDAGAYQPYRVESMEQSVDRVGCDQSIFPRRHDVVFYSVRVDMLI